VAAIIRHVCEVIWRELKDIVMCEPSEDKWIAIAQGFERNVKIPNCIGALDGKHIRLTNPDYAGSLYRNYKNFFSLVLMAMCDANYCWSTPWKPCPK
jgi:hypothetical protein